MPATPNILLVEDNLADQKLMLMAFKSKEWEKSTHVVSDGREALDFLNRKGKYPSAPRPDLIVLDLNLPVKDGRQVLKEIKESPKLRDIPVVIFTSSESEKDINSAYDLGANSYVTKRSGLDEYLGAVEEIQKYWLTLSELPIH